MPDTLTYLAKKYLYILLYFLEFGMELFENRQKLLDFYHVIGLV